MANGIAGAVFRPRAGRIGPRAGSLLGFMAAVFMVLAGQAQAQSFHVTQIATVPNSTIVAGSDLVIVKWTGGTAPFQVESCTNYSGQWQEWQDVAGITAGTSQTNIMTAPSANYRVASVAAVMAASSDKTAPTVPTGLAATTVNSHQANLAWIASVDPGTDATGVKGYNVYRNGIFLNQVKAPGTATSDSHLKPSTTNTYVVCAVDNAYNQSAPSSPAIAVTPISGGCNYAISPPNATFTSAGGTSNLTVTASAGCSWAALSSTNWITITSGANGTGNGTVGFSVAANTNTTARSSTLLVAEHNVTVTQAAATDTTPPTVSLTTPANGSIVSNTVTLTASASDNIGVTKVEFYRDGTNLVGMATATPYNVSYDTTAITNGSRNFSAKAYDAVTNSTMSASISVTVNNPPPPDTTPPSVSLTAPASGSIVSNIITLTASASDNVGVTKVEFYRDGTTLVGTDTTSPYNVSYDTTTITNGSHDFSAKAYDAVTNSTMSASISVNVNNPPPVDTTPPSVSLTAPASGNIVSNTITLTASASDNVGVTKVEFYRDGTNLVGTATTAPYSASFDTTTITNGPHNFTAKAYDAATNSAMTASISVTVSNPPPADTTPPTVLLTAPASGSIVSNTITLTASASDNVGVTKVEFYRDGTTLVGTATTSPFSVSYDTTTITNGSHNFSAKAYDAATNSTLSASNLVTVSNVVIITPGQLQWLRTMVSPNGYNAEGWSIAADSSNNTVVAGDFTYGVDFGNGTSFTLNGGYTGLFIAKYTPSGGLLWAKTFGGAAQSGIAKSVAVDSQNNIIVAGYFSGTLDFGGVALTAYDPYQMFFPDMFVAKYSPSGSLLWVRQFGGAFGDLGTSVAVDGSDNVVMLGRLQSANVNFGGGIILSAPGTSSLALVKLSPSGTTLWAKAYGTGSVIPSSVAIDRSGDVAVTGQFGTASDLGGGSISSANSGNQSTFVVKYSGADGGYRWAKAFGGSTVDSGLGIAADPSTGNIVVTGGFMGTANFGGGAVSSIGEGVFLAGYDTSGNFLWAQTYGTSSSASSSGNALKIDANGNLAVTGFKGGAWFIGGTWNFNSGFFVQSYTISGNAAPVLKWFKFPGAGSTGSSVGNGIALDSLGHILTTGSLSFGTVDFGGIWATTTPNSYYGLVAEYTR